MNNINPPKKAIILARKGTSRCRKALRYNVKTLFSLSTSVPKRNSKNEIKIEMKYWNRKHIIFLKINLLLILLQHSLILYFSYFLCIFIFYFLCTKTSVSLKPRYKQIGDWITTASKLFSSWVFSFSDEPPIVRGRRWVDASRFRVSESL